MRQNNDIGRKGRLRASIEDALADFGTAVAIYRAGAWIGSAQGVVDAEAHSRVAGADLAAFRFLYRCYLRMPVDAAGGDRLFANGVWFLVKDIDAGVSLHLVLTCLCEKLPAGP